MEVYADNLFPILTLFYLLFPAEWCLFFFGKVFICLLISLLSYDCWLDAVLRVHLERRKQTIITRITNLFEKIIKSVIADSKYAVGKQDKD